MSNEMTSSTTGSRSREQQSNAAELLVPPAMLAVSAAAGMAGYLHLGLAPELAAAIALAFFCVLLLCHVVLRPMPAPGHTAERRPPAIVSPLARARMQEETAAGRDAPSVQVNAEPLVGDRGAPRSTPRPRPPAALKGAPTGAAIGVEPAKAPLTEPIAKQPAAAAVTEQAATTALPELKPVPPPVGAGWTYRPVDLKLPTLVDDESAASGDIVGLGALRPTIADDVPSQAPASEAERIDGILKRLAQQIRAGSEATPSPAAGAAGMHARADEQTPAPQSDAALQNAVDALRATVEAMRIGGRAAASPEAATPSGARDPTVLPTPAELRVAAVAEALAAERAEVFLDPILGLAEGSARHFEISVRLRAADGEVLERSDVSEAERSDVSAAVRGAGLLPLLDALGVRHSAGFALKLERRGRDGTVFSTVAGETLSSPAFVADVAGRHAQGIADRLVLTFEQSEVAALGAAQMAVLAELNDLGFRFALHGLANLDMDFEALADVGFEFVKLDADVFASGLALAGGQVPAADLGRFFADHDLTVIAGRIESEEARSRMLGYGVALGQGPLFGAPRAVPVGVPGAGEGLAA